MATLHARGKGRAAVVFAKGSLERLLPACADALDAGGGLGRLDPHRVRGHADEMAGRGLRVLAFVRRELPAGTTRIHHADLEGGLTLLGLQAMMDPPRPEAAEAVAACQRAGIAVKMITGDHVGTAAAIARQIGIAPPAGHDTTTATGAELDRMSDEELIEAAAGRSVFARVSPEHKLRLVKALQARRQVVAMTGDGVNDAPALRRADIGIAMGRGGTEVAREAAAMVLTDDNFATIEAAVEEGRGIFDNLTKFLVWTLPTNGGEGLVVLLAVLLDVALPVLPVHILWINMSTAIFLGTTLAFEPKERGLMDRPPRTLDAPILQRPLLVRLAVVSLMLALASFAVDRIALAWGASAAGARTVAATMFIVGEAIYLFNCRSLTRSMFTVGVFSNRWVWTGLAAMMALQVAFIYAPVMNRLFESAPFPAELWPVVLAFGVAIYGVVGVEKRISRRRLEA
jgi:Ca2+-transporting ATPase